MTIPHPQRCETCQSFYYREIPAVKVPRCHWTCTEVSPSGKCNCIPSHYVEMPKDCASHPQRCLENECKLRNSCPLCYVPPCASHSTASNERDEVITLNSNLLFTAEQVCEVQFLKSVIENQQIHMKNLNEMIAGEQQIRGKVLDELRQFCDEMEPPPILDEECHRIERAVLSKIIKKILELRPYSTASNDSDVTEQCENCIRKGLRDCMYHGYPDDTIPRSCAYKIGNAAVDTVYDVPVAIRKQGEQR